MLEAKVFTQRSVRDFDGHSHKLPALDADVRLIAARSDVIVVCQIDIEAYLLGNGTESGEVLELLPVAWIGAIDRANIETWWDVVQDVFPHAVARYVLVALCLVKIEKRRGSYRSAVGNDWYLHTASFCRVYANSRCAKSFVGVGL